MTHLRLIAVLAVLALHASCGGGGEDQLEDLATTIPVNCSLQPEICK